MYLIMLVVSMLLPMRVSAQTVKGKLVDESNHPLPYANVWCCCLCRIRHL